MKRALVRSGVMYFFSYQYHGGTEHMDIQIKIQGK